MLALDACLYILKFNLDVIATFDKGLNVEMRKICSFAVAENSENPMINTRKSRKPVQRAWTLEFGIGQHGWRIWLVRKQAADFF